SAPAVADIIAWRGQSRAAVERVIAGTGSQIDRHGLDYYCRLFKNPGHVAGALAMMANWDLARFAAALPRLDVDTILIAATKDRAISPSDAATVARLVRKAHVVSVDEAGHLAHEERPGEIARIIFTLAEAISQPTSLRKYSGQ